MHDAAISQNLPCSGANKDKGSSFAIQMRRPLANVSATHRLLHAYNMSLQAIVLVHSTSISNLGDMSWCTMPPVQDFLQIDRVSTA